MATSVSFYRTFTYDPSIRNHVLAFYEKLLKDPTNPSLHVEPVQGAADKRVRTARVTQKYRAVLFELHSENLQQFVIIDILNHDDAYALATSKTFVVNGVSGVPQLVDAESQVDARGLSEEEIESRAKKLAAEMVAEQRAKQEAEEASDSAADADAIQTEDASAAPAASREEVRPWEMVDADKHALTDELGLSPQTVALMEAAETVAQLEATLVTVPAWEHDAVVGLLVGMSIAEVREDLGLERVAVEDADSDKALVESITSPAAQRDFVTDPGEEELDAILQGSFAQWRVYLHPSQRRAVEAEHSGSARVTGGAGTGKTVVVVHRTKHLLKKNPKARVFLTTYTRELATALKAQMNELYPTFLEAPVHGAPGLWISGVDALVFSVLKNAQSTERAAALKDVLGIEADFLPSGLDGVEEKRLWQEAAELKGGDLPTEKSHPTFLSQ